MQNSLLERQPLLRFSYSKPIKFDLQKKIEKIKAEQSVRSAAACDARRTTRPTLHIARYILDSCGSEKLLEEDGYGGWRVGAIRWRCGG